MSNTSGENQEKGKSDLSRNKKISSQTPQNNEAIHDNQTMHTDPSSTTVSQVSFDDDSSKSMPLREPGSSLKSSFTKERESCKDYESPLSHSRSGKSSADPSEESSLSHKEGMSTSEVTMGCVSEGSCFEPSVVSSSGGDSKSQMARTNQTVATVPQSGSTTMAFKLLVSNNMAGSIIGRSGKTISDLQVQSASRIKLSQNGTYYPGTTDRVCLIQGPNNNVKLALNLILQQLHDLYRQQINQQMMTDSASNSNKKNAIPQHSQNTPVEGQENFEFLRENDTASNAQAQNVILSDESDPLHAKSFSNKASFVVRVLIPIACSGLIIGRAGCNVKSIAETSGVSSIRLAPKDGDDFHQSVISSLQQQPQQTPSLLLIPHQQTTSERIVTISAHDLSSCIKCCHLILDTMALQPDLSRYINMTTSYSKPAAATNATILTSTQTNMPDNVASFVVASSSNFTSSVASAQQQQSPVMSSTGTFSPNEPNSFRLSSNQPHQNIGLTGPMNHQYPANILRYSSGNYFTNNDGSASSQSNTSVILPTTQMPISNLSGEPGSYSQTHHQPPVSPSLYLVTSQTSSRNMFVLGPAQALGPNAPSANQPRQSSGVVLPSAGMQTNQYLEPQRAPQGGYEEQLSPQITQQYASSRQYLPANRNRDENQLLQSESDTRGSDNINRQGAQQPFSRQMAVPDYLIGAILGPGGKTLSELQITTNTNIKISQRGVFVPGTNDRIVTISGTYLNITNAQYFITQRLARSANRISPSADISAQHPQQRSSSHSKKQLYNREDSN